jgi:hypothetical protein
VSTQEEALSAWSKLVNSLQPRLPLRRGILGDGAGNVDVPNRPGFAWIRYEENQSRLSMVRCFLALDDGTPVLVGKWHVEDDYEQVLSVNWGPYSTDLRPEDMARYATQPHGETHHGTYGSDPAYIDLNNLVVGRVKATDPASLFVVVESFSYPFDDEVRDYGGNVVDLTASVPGVAGQHRLVLVYFDLDAETTGVVEGDTSPITVDAGIPTLQGVRAIPLAHVDLENGQTTILDFQDIWQRKLVLGSIGGEAVTALKLAIVHEGSVTTHDGEIVWSI